ncbi:EamA family transporter [Cohnella caldifontis]|uniref:EamA family transporter n=1 Tax=Cohnella caldifontis TaxID=3027471 RepID=UPI0023EBE113|nr:DMT family transporter [Cohnella sp. YIM B05605]
MNTYRNGIAALLVMLGAASYGLMTPVVKMAVADGWGPGALSFAQIVSGTAMLLIVWLIRFRLRPSLRMKPGTWIRLAFIGICGLSLTTVFYNEALARLDASLAVVLLFQYTWITILLESIRAKRWPTRQEAVASVLIFAGTLLAAGLIEQGIGRLDVEGLLFGLLSALTYSLFFFLSGSLPSSQEPYTKSSVMALSSLAFISVMHGAGTGGPAGSGSVPIAVWGFLLGLLGSALPAICFNAGIPRIGPGLAALLGALELPIAVLASFALLGEPLTWVQGFGVVLLLAGIVAAQSRMGEKAGNRPGSEE